MVNIILPLHFVHLPTNGGRRNFSLQFTQRNSCIENFLRLPFVSFKKCFSMTNLATSDVSTLRNFSAKSIWPLNFSSIEGKVLYALHLTVRLRLVISCVKPIFSYCSGLPKKALI